MPGDRTDPRWDRARHARCPERSTEDTWLRLGVLIGTIQQHECRDDDLHLVFRELPILGPESTLASRAALASRAQGCCSACNFDPQYQATSIAYRADRRATHAPNNNKDSVQCESLCHATDLESVRFRVRVDRASAVAGLLRGFFSSAPEGIGRSQQLALALAARSRLLRDYLGEELLRQNEEDQKGRLYGLYQIFRDQVFHELTLKEFADAFAQMLAYGLFLAKLNSENATITLQNARQFVPGSFRLIRELVDLLPDLKSQEYRDVRWVIEEVLSIVNGLDMAGIREDLSLRGRKTISRRVRAASEEEHRLFERDPFIYFYEDYLKAYDKATRKGRGVYYTPPPVVHFIVRAIDDILKDTFEIPSGLADHQRVTVLDFACGTGTFLLEVFERIFEQIGDADAGHADLIVREHLLKNIFGFEYLIAPYTIAHLKLSPVPEGQGARTKG